MDEVSKAGRTILFVSHNMQAIKQLCNKFIYLKDGAVVEIGESKNIISKYLKGSQDSDTDNSVGKKIADITNNNYFKLLEISLLQNEENVFNLVENGSDFTVSIKYKVFERVSGLRIYIDLVDEYDALIFRSFHDEQSSEIPVMERGLYLSKVCIPKNILGPIPYVLKINAGIYNVRNLFTIDIPISVENSGQYNQAYLGDSFRGKLGIVLPWNTNKIEGGI